MLPDWPETKDRIGEAFFRFIRSEVEARLGFLAEVKQSVVHEGDGTVISRADGSRAEQGFTPVSAEMAIPDDEFAGLPIRAVLERLRGVAEVLARGRSEHAFSVFDATCQEVGNVVDAGGGPLTPELILKTWETVVIVFDVHGRPEMPTIVVGPGQQDAVREALSRIDRDPELKRRADEIIQRKREEWFAREADRALAG